MCVCQDLEALRSLPSPLGWQVGARWALDRDEGSSPASVLASSTPIAHAQKPLSWAGWLGALAAPQPHASFLLGPHADPPLWALQQAQVGERPSLEHNVAPCSPARLSLLELAHFLPGPWGLFQGK